MSKNSKMYVFSIVDVLNKLTVSSFMMSDIQTAKLAFANYMIGQEPHKYNLYIIGEIENIKKSLVWSGLEADYANKQKNIIKKEDQNTEKIHIQEKLIKFPEEIKQEKNTAKILQFLFKGKKIENR